MATTTPAFRAGDALRIRGERWRVRRWTPYDGASIVDVVGTDRSNRGEPGRFLLPFEPAEPLPPASTPRVVRAAEWRLLARRALADATPAWHSLRAAAAAALTLVPFQLEPALAIVSGRANRLLIADEVGLGKTVQAALIVAEVLAREPDARVLVVCPAGLREQWRDELRERVHLAAVVVDAAGLGRLSAARDAGANPWATEPLLLTSIDFVKRPEVMRSLEALIWDVVVFDEAHALCGTSDRAAAASLLAARARRVVLLTATPHSGDEEAFRRMCRLGELGGDPPLLTFRRTRAEVSLQRPRRMTMLRVRPSRSEAAVHGAMAAYAARVFASAADPGARLAMMVLLRRACSSAASLASSIERRLALLADASTASPQLPLPFVEDAASDEAPDVVLAAPGLADADEERGLLEELLRLAQDAIAAETKVLALVRLLRRVREPAIVFTEYRDTLAHLRAHLPGRIACLHGGMTLRERRASTREFTAGGVDLLLATDAASEGLNLHQRCRLVINLELPWTPARLEQRVGRVDRFGQHRTAHAIALVGRGTSEGTVLRRFAARLDRARESLTALRPGGADLREAGCREASRLAAARALGDAGARRLDARPPICVVRARRRQPERIWVWRVPFAGANGRWQWEALLAVAATAPRIPDAPAATRAALGGDRPALVRAREEAVERQLALATADVRRALAALAARERAIVETLRSRHARLAATLLQPGLFDHRAGRAAAAQAALLDEALARSAAWARPLEAARCLHADASDLLFAVALQ